MIYGHRNADSRWRRKRESELEGRIGKWGERVVDEKNARVRHRQAGKVQFATTKGEGLGIGEDKRTRRRSDERVRGDPRKAGFESIRGE